MGINKPIYDEHGNKIHYEQQRQIDVKQYKLLDDDRDFTALLSMLYFFCFLFFVFIFIFCEFA